MVINSNDIIRNIIALIIIVLTIWFFKTYSPKLELKTSGMYLPLTNSYPSISKESVKVVSEHHIQVDYLYSHRNIGTISVIVPFDNDIRKAEQDSVDFAKKLAAKNGANLVEINMVQGPRRWFNTSHDVLRIQASAYVG